MDRLENGVQLENGDRPKNGASHRLETGALATLGLVLMLLMFGGPCRAQADAAPRLEIPVEDARALGLRIWPSTVSPVRKPKRRIWLGLT